MTLRGGGVTGAGEGEVTGAGAGDLTGAGEATAAGDREATGADAGDLTGAGEATAAGDREVTGAGGGDVVVVTGLTKRFRGGTVAVAGLDLRVARGEVFGFLGPNGAGKTTTMRMLVGLVRPTSGSLTVAGHPAGSARSLARVGSLIESPAFYPHLSGRDNLRMLARYCGAGDDRVDAALEEVAMTGRAGRAYRTFSLGMKQRLGVAAALLKDPELLILDEPTNGLDPAGTAAMRELVASLRRAHRAVLLSSHLLGEVEHLCDRVAVLRAGRFVAEGTVDELRATAGGSTLLVRATPADRALDLLRGHPAVRAAEPDGAALRVTADPDAAAVLNRDLVLAGIEVAELRAERRSLEDVFLRLTEDGPGLESDAELRSEVAAR